MGNANACLNMQHSRASRAAFSDAGHSVENVKTPNTILQDENFLLQLLFPSNLILRETPVISSAQPKTHLKHNINYIFTFLCDSCWRSQSGMSDVHDFSSALACVKAWEVNILYKQPSEQHWSQYCSTEERKLLQALPIAQNCALAEQLPDKNTHVLYSGENRWK